MAEIKKRGGARSGSGPKRKDPDEKKQTVHFMVKRKYVDIARGIIKPIVDQINK
jgi:hypothetical protein